MQEKILLFSSLFIGLLILLFQFILYKKVQSNIKCSVSPHFVTISPSIQHFKELIISLYNLKKHFNKVIVENNIDDKCRPIKSSLTKIENLFKELGFEVIDYTNQKYNDGMNIDVISTIHSDTASAVIKETIEPSIIYNGELISKAKVIKEINGGGENE